MNIQILKKLGLPSVAISMIVVVWLVGTTEFKDGKTFLAYWHDVHFQLPTAYDLAANKAINKKIDAGALMQGYEYLLKEHAKKLDGEIKEYCQDHTPTECQLKLEGWKSENEFRQNKLDHMRKLYQKSQTDIELLLAGKIPL